MQNNITTIVGRKGQGKSLLAKSLIMQFDGHVFVYDFLGEYQGSVYSNIQEFIDTYKKSNIHIYRNTEDFDTFLNSVWAFSKLSQKKILMVLDEMHLWYTTSRQAGIQQIFRFSRHRNIDIIVISQRFYDLPVIVRSLTDTFYIFNITEPYDLKYIDQYVSQISERLPKLPVFSYLKIKI